MKLRRSPTVWVKFIRATILGRQEGRHISTYNRNWPQSYGAPEPGAIREANLYTGGRFRLVDGKASADALRLLCLRGLWSRGDGQKRTICWKSARHSDLRYGRSSRSTGRLRDDATESVARTRETSPRCGDVILVRASRDAKLYRLSWKDVKDGRRGATVALLH